MNNKIKWTGALFLLLNGSWVWAASLPADLTWETNDTDSDSFFAWQEQIAGTDPTNFGSRFQVSGFKFQASNTIVTWNAITGRVYSVEANTNSLVTSHWSLVTNGLPATGVWTDTMHGADDLINYRLGVEKP